MRFRFPRTGKVDGVVDDDDGADVTADSDEPVDAAGFAFLARVTLGNVALHQQRSSQPFFKREDPEYQAAYSNKVCCMQS
jgi:hypothetical protein